VIRNTCVLFFAMLAWACATPALPPATATEQAGLKVDEYQLGVGDRLRVLVYDEATLSGEFAVNSDGNLSLPLIGEVPAREKRVGDVRRDVEAKLANGYLINPRVSMEVLTFRPFYILGEVKAPGQYPYTVGLTLSGAVARAEGFTYRANQKRVFVKSAGQADEREVTITASTPVNPGDVIRVTERFF
jgi:protein involved in polysaccharide export with SLBB domain